jgi:hypothetical protein
MNILLLNKIFITTPKTSYGIHIGWWVYVVRAKGAGRMINEACEVVLTFCLSRMEPRPSIAIFVIVSSCRRFNEFPFGPSNFPTKLN